jgi:GNAT superfamily N-acetyltransferase
MDELIIREFDEKDSVEELTELLHRAYKKLAVMGLKFVATYLTPESTKKQLEKGTCFVAEMNNKIVGTIFYYHKMFKDAPPFYKKETVGLFGKFAVEPELQEKGIGKRLLVHTENYARSDGKKELALDTSEKAHHLIDYYKKNGYKFVHYWQWDVTNYRSVIMAKTL